MVNRNSKLVKRSATWLGRLFIAARRRHGWRNRRHRIHAVDPDLEEDSTGAFQSGTERRTARRGFLTALVASLAAAAVAADDLVLRNGRVLTMLDGPEYRPMAVVVRDGKFVAGEPAADARTIDLAGRYVIPGLAEMHAHVPAPRLDAPRYRDDVLFLWVAGGITWARGMMGHSSHLPLRDALAAHEILGPALTISGPSFSGGSIHSVFQAVRRVREQKAAGYDFLKIHPGLSQQQFAALAGTAKAEGIAFAGHVSAAVGLLDSLEAGQQTIDHLDGFIETLVAPARLANRSPSWFGADLVSLVEEARMVPLLAALKASGAALVPTETLLENVTGPLAELQAREEYAYLPKTMRQAYSHAVADSERGFAPESAVAFLALRKRLIGAAHEAGIPVLLGSDSPQIFNVPGFSIHRELQAMVAAGLTPFEAIAAGTTAPARFFGLADVRGSIAPGRAADLIVLHDDPLADIVHTRAIAAVMVRGRYLPRAELDAKLNGIRRRYQ